MRVSGLAAAEQNYMLLEERSIHILLIDDDELDAMAIERLLKKSSLVYTFTVFDNAGKAKEHLLEAAANYDCIFLDYQLPGTDGLDLLKQFRALGVTTPVAILTSQGDERIAVEMIKNGAFDYFVKSDVTVDFLTRTVLAAIRLKKAETDKAEAERKIKEGTAQITAILESSSHNIFAIDKNLNYIAFNQAHFNTIKNVQGIEIQVGMSVFEGLKNIDPVALENYKQAFDGIRYTTIYEGVSAYFETTYNPIRNESGEITGVAVYAMDISEKINAEKELMKAKVEAEMAAKAKSDFLSNMSHEIRTPMNAIVGMSDLLLDKGFKGEEEEYLKSIKYSADNLLVIINDILDFSKIEAGKVTFESIDFNIYEQLEDLKRTFKHTARDKGIKLQTEIADHVPEMVKGDPYRLNQILFNLVGNAIKFTTTGEITIALSVLREEAERHILSLKVIDTGIGIPENKINSIFESFSQAYTDTTRKFGGTGLGLAITKNLTQLQGGNISLESTYGVGTTFTVNLPMEKSAADVQKGNNEQLLNNKSLKNVKVLIVEDNAMNQFVAKQILSKWDAITAIANNGKEAIEILTSQSFDIVLMDLQMPEMSGYEATSYIRAKNTTVIDSNVPIIALTADAFAETKQKVMESGMNDFITKPFNQEELYSKIIRQVPVN